MSTENNNRTRLQELSGSDFEVADGQPDIRGWDVKDGGGRKLGKVRELIFDETSLKVRYIVLDFRGNEFDLDNRRVLVPIGTATLHEKEDDVIIPGLGVTQLNELPDYHDDITPDAERNVRNVFAGIGAVSLAGTNTQSTSEDFYSHDQFNEDNLYRNRTKTTQVSTPSPIVNEDLNTPKRDVHNRRLRARIFDNPDRPTTNLNEQNSAVSHNLVSQPIVSSHSSDEQNYVPASSATPSPREDNHPGDEVSLHRDVNESEVSLNDTTTHTDVHIERDDDERLHNRHNTD